MSDFSQRIANLSQEKRALLELQLMQKALAGDKLESIPRRDTSAPCPLSFAQQRLWFLDTLEPDSSVYNIPSAFRLSGALKVSALEQSIGEIIRRHESLRTTFPAVDGEPLQVIVDDPNFSLPVVDLSASQKTDRESEIHRLAVEEANRSFNLAQGPLFRVALLKVDGEDHVLLLTMHHIISDGWSLDVLFRELSSLYRAFSSGIPSPLPELPIQYTDFAVWQQQWLQGEVLETQLNYWRQRLDDASPTLELPADRRRPPIQTYKGARQALMLPKPLTEGLRALSAEGEATLFMTLLAAFQTLIYRYTGQKDIIVGSPIANRNRTEIEGLIGLFVNTLVMRTDFSGEPGFRELLNRVREMSFGAYAHQDFPFEKLVEALKPERDLSRFPMVQAMFALQNVPRRPLELSELKVSPIEQKNDAAMFDLTLFLLEVEDGIEGSIEYCTDLFDSARISLMAGHYQTLLEGIVANPDQLISKLPLLTRREQYQLLTDWNDTRLDYPKDRSIPELFEEQVKRTPDAIAVVFGEQMVPYKELNRRANQLAHYLQTLGVGPEVLVGVCTERSIDIMVGLLGILKTGGAFVPLDPTYPKARLAFMLQDSGVSVLLTQKRLLGALPEHGAQVICLDSDWKLIPRESDKNLDGGAAAGNLAYVMYTSGSTGKPKGVLGLHRGAINRFNWMWQTYPFEVDEVCCQKTSISFVDSIWEIFGSLLKGIKSVIISDEVVKEPRRFIKYLADEEITRIITVPTFLRVILDTHPDLQKRLPKLNFWISSGEILSKELCQRFYEKMPQSVLLNLYGSSEVSADVTCYDTSSMNQESHSVPIGRPVANTQVYILDPYLQPVPIGVPGELYIDGEGLAAGYLNLSKITENVFIPNPFSDRPDSRLYKTGDKGRWLADGNIEYIGRIDHQVKMRGFRIELGEVEAVLNKHLDVDDNVVVAREDRPNDKRLVAYVVLRQKSAVATHELYRFLKQNLPDYMLPSAFVILDTLPLTPSGKIDRKILPAPNEAFIEPSDAILAPCDELELQLTKTWEKVLGVQPIGVNDNFFELGGHSLLAVQLFTQIEKILGKRLPLTVLYQAPTVQQMADILRELGWSAPLSSLEAIESETSGMGSIKQKITKYIPVKSVPYIRKQYLKLKEQPGYIFVKEKYFKLKKQPANLYLKREYLKAKRSIIKRFLSYQPSQLEKKLREMGLSDADSVYMHSAFNPFNGCLGGPMSIINCILNVIGDSGNLMMVSMPYTGYTVDYLKAVKTFDVTKTESSMGIITEIFRRQKNVLRSLNPAHSILAFGPDAEWIISDHEKTMYSCGKGSPFEKILELNAKAIFFDVPFWIMTFFHFLEDKFEDCSPVNVYEVEPIESTVINSNGDRIAVKTYVSSKEARKTRSARVLAQELKNRNQIKTAKIGNTKLILVNLNDVVDCAQDLVTAGKHLYLV